MTELTQSELEMLQAAKLVPFQELRPLRSQTQAAFDLAVSALVAKGMAWRDDKPRLTAQGMIRACFSADAKG